MSRNTAKYAAAKDAWRKLYPNEIGLAFDLDSDGLYRELFRRGYEWDRDAGHFVPISAFSGGYDSIFAFDDGTPSDVVHVRLECHPSRMDEAIERASKMGLLIGDIGDPDPNRAGAGCRVYIKARFPGALKRKTSNPALEADMPEDII